MVFTIEIVDLGGTSQLQVTLSRPSIMTRWQCVRFNAILRLVGAVKAITKKANVAGHRLKATVTRTDSDQDKATASTVIPLITERGSPVSFDDDGPRAVAAAVSSVRVDEGRYRHPVVARHEPERRHGGWLDHGESDGAARAGGSIAGLVNFGSDGPRCQTLCVCRRHHRENERARPHVEADRAGNLPESPSPIRCR